MATFWEHFKLNWKFIGFSKRLAIITIVGLSISVAMITQNILFLNSFRNNAFNEFTTDTTDTFIEINMDHIGTFSDVILSMFKTDVDSEFEDLDIETSSYSQEWIPYKEFFLMLFNEKYHENEFHNTYLVGIDEIYLPLLEPLITSGEIPENGEKVIITKSQTLEETDLALNTSFEAYVPIGTESNPWISYGLGLDDAGTLLEFTGIINVDEITFGDIPVAPEIQVFIDMVLNLGAEIIITDSKTAISTVGSIDYSINDISIFGRIYFNLNEFDVFQLDNTLDQLQIFVNSLQEALIEDVDAFTSNYEIKIDSRVIPLLSNFRREFRIFQIFLMVFMLPTLGMSLILTAFATNQVKKKRDLHISKLHQRGSSRQMIFSFMVFELLIYSLLAVIIGFLIGWPYTLIALKSEGFFTFTGAAALPVPSIITIVICLGVGFGIAYFSNALSIWRNTKTTVEEALQEQNEKKPFWERFYIDIFLLIIGIILWIIASSRISGGSTTAIEFTFYFATPAPILIMIGTIMLATRIYPYIVKFISDLMFKIPRVEISAISARNAIRRRGSTTRTLILMTLTFTLTVATVIIPDSYREFDIEDSYYSLGADIVVNQVDITNPNYKRTVAAIEGVEAASYVGLLELSNSESDLLYTISILGVELDNFSKVAFEEPEYTQGQMMTNLIKSINKSNDVIGQADQMALLNLGNNKTFVIKNWRLNETTNNLEEVSYPVDFVDFYEYWPTLYTDPPSATSKEVKIGLIANISLTYQIARYDYDVQGKLIVKVKEGYSISEVAGEIESTTRYETVNIEELLLISEGTLKATVLFGALNTSFIISMLISSATLITMMLIQAVEREKELAVMKSMGISPRQLFNFFITEAIVILIFAMILGGGLGVGSSVMIMKILKIGSVFPPHENIFSVIKIVWTTLAIFGIGLISTIIPIIINSRKGIAGAMKAI
ncbi:MAG TPA: ABC transporter permease [candidate division Zixibacteria bacterium]|nr:ABC transporter permease [candidate division Zixibacteria bacterium]